ncbi:MAG: globin [Luteolibacter sp.]
MDEQMTFEAMGEDGISRLVAAFYRRVRQDDIIGPMYPADDWEGSEERLRDFLLFRIGGITRYMENRGHPRLRMRHMPFTISERERDRWVLLMRESMDETGVPAEARLWLGPFFEQVADFLRNHPGHGG